MSTKTTFKRIALVAVAALGFGVLSVVPSQAAVSALTVSTPTAGTSGALNARTDSTTASTFSVSALFDAGMADTVTVSFVQSGDFPATAAVYPVMAFLETTTAAATQVDTSTVQNGSTSAYVTAFSATESITASGVYSISRSSAGGAGYAGAKFGLFLESATSTVRPAGAYNFTIIVKQYSAGVATPVTTTYPATITIAAAAAAKPAVSTAATAYIQATSSPDWASAVADSVTTGSLVAGTQIGTIRVVNQSSAGVSAIDTVTVSMTGVGYLLTGTEGPASAVTGRSFVVTNENILDLKVLADGASGTGTITITTGVGASFVKTVTFYDTKPAKAVTTVAKAYIKAGTGSVADVFATVVTDALGNAITDTGATVTAAPTDTATTVGGAVACTYSTSKAAWLCSATGLSATKFGPVAYTFTATGADAAATVVKTTASVTFSDVVATKAVLAGPATGTPGATVEYTLTLTEKNGYPVADQTYGVGGAGGVLFSATAADTVVSGWTTAPFNASDSYTSVSGVLTSKAVLPIAGTASLSMTLVGDGLQTLAANAIDKTIGKTKVTASTEITNPGVDAATDAANEATDAANAATDAALAAAEAADAATTAAQEASDAVAALSESVTKLIAGLQAQIKSLAAVVAKIAKKVKA